ncbi:MAG: hypothetical protein Kow0027_06000 [Saprospiraceae bacterium]
MKKQILLLTTIISSTALTAQEFQEISTGAGYSKQAYIRIADNHQTQVANDAWDIAFAVGPSDAGIFINESAGTGMGQVLPSFQLFDGGTDDFDATPDTSFAFQNPLFNSEKSWASGALNEVADPTNPFDFGWGVYDPTNHTIAGGRVFVAKLRNGQYLKFQVQSLASGTYSFRYANLDGTGETTKTIAKADHAGRLLAYFSFNSGETVSVEPSDGFDLLFCRYVTPLEDGNGGTLNYAVTGILSGPGVEVAQADGIDPATVVFDGYEDSLSTDLDIIGHDWKTFDLATFQWLLPEDRVYFVKTADGHLWKIRFIDFEGSSTGTATFEKTDLGLLNSVGDEHSPLDAFGVFPNPARSEAKLVFSVKNSVAGPTQVWLTDQFGRVVFQQKIQVATGLNSLDIPVTNLPEGVYFLGLSIGNQRFTDKVVVVK